MSSSTFPRPAVLAALLTGGGLTALLLLPYATNGLWFDDSLNSLIKPLLARSGKSLWGFSMQISESWLVGSGRILLLWPWLYTFFYIFHEPKVVRLIDLAFLLAHIGLVVLLLRRLRISWPTVALFLPPALIAVSSKYQSALFWGDAHIPVYYEYFGLAFLLAAAMSELVRRVRIAGLVIAPVFALYLAMNWTVNVAQAAHLDMAFQEPRDSFTAALRQGLLTRSGTGTS